MKKSCNNFVAKLCASLLALAGLALLAMPVAQADNSRYVIKGGEVYDTETDLTWQRCSVGLRWVEGRGCKGVTKKEFTFDDAQKQATGNLRVPDKDELASLIVEGKSPAIDQEAFPDMSDGSLRYWSSTPKNAWIGWYVRFSGGYVGVHDGDRSDTHAVRLVRSGQ